MMSDTNARRLIGRVRRRAAHLALGVVILGACVNEEEEPSVRCTPIVGPSGGRAWVIECEEHRECLWKAGRLCHFGYEIVDSAHTTTGGSFHGAVIGHAVVGGTEEDSVDTLTIECRR